MNGQVQKNKKTEVYSISGFHDTLASPILYPVIVISLVLGIASIFGFTQNPLKLKAIVYVMHQKISDTQADVNALPNKYYATIKLRKSSIKVL